MLGVLLTDNHTMTKCFTLYTTMSSGFKRGRFHYFTEGHVDSGESVCVAHINQMFLLLINQG